MYIYTLNIGELGWVRRICESIDPNLTLAKKKKKKNWEPNTTHQPLKIDQARLGLVGRRVSCISRQGHLVRCDVPLM